MSLKIIRKTRLPSRGKDQDQDHVDEKSPIVEAKASGKAEQSWEADDHQDSRWSQGEP